MFNTNTFYPYYNNLQSIAGPRISPVARIEEADTIYPDLQGTPLFFFDQSRNEFYVKQRKVQTGEIELLRYALVEAPTRAVNAQKGINTYDEQLNALKSDIERLNEAVGIKVKKAVKDDEQ